ncbi:hypothetical protein ACLOJK_005241 [Asimina triloba]
MTTSVEQYCRDTVMIIWHYHGGCQSGRVVDHDYRVLGVDASRVIDGSTFNYSPGTNPKATLAQALIGPAHIRTAKYYNLTNFRPLAHALIGPTHISTAGYYRPTSFCLIRPRTTPTGGVSL